MIAGGAINARMNQGMTNVDEEGFKDANLLAGDAIINYRTVASLANDREIVNTYVKYIEEPSRLSIRKSHY